MGVILNMVVAGVTAAILYVFVKAYLSAKGTWRERLLAAGKESWTMVWAGAVVVGTGLINTVSMAAGLLDEGWGEHIRMFLPSEYVAWFVIGSYLITMAARMRSLRKG